MPVELPLPGRIEVRDLHDGAQIAGTVGVAAELAVPVLLPVRPLQILGLGVTMRRRSCSNQSACRLLSRPATCTLSQRIWSFRSASRDSGSPSAGRVGAVVADNPRQGTQVPFAGRHPSCHQIPLPTVLRLRRLGIGRTPDGSDGAGLHTLGS